MVGLSPWCLIFMLSPGRILLSSLYHRPSTSTSLTSHRKFTTWRSIVSTSSSSLTIRMSLAGGRHLDHFYKHVQCLKRTKKESTAILAALSTENTNISRPMWSPHLTLCSVRLIQTAGSWNNIMNKLMRDERLVYQSCRSSTASESFRLRQISVYTCKMDQQYWK